MSLVLMLMGYLLAASIGWTPLALWLFLLRPLKEEGFLFGWVILCPVFIGFGTGVMIKLFQ